MGFGGLLGCNCSCSVVPLDLGGNLEVVRGGRVGIGRRSYGVPAIRTRPIGARGPGPTLTVISLIYNVLNIILSYYNCAAYFSPVLSVTTFIYNLITPGYRGNGHRNVTATNFVLNVMNFTVLILYIFTVTIFCVLGTIFNVDLFTVSDTNVLCWSRWERFKGGS